MFWLVGFFWVFFSGLVGRFDSESKQDVVLLLCGGMWRVTVLAVTDDSCRMCSTVGCLESRVSMVTMRYRVSRSPNEMQK